MAGALLRPNGGEGSPKQEVNAPGLECEAAEVGLIDFRADDTRFKDNRPGHQALDFALDAVVPLPHLLPDDVEARAGDDRLTEADFVGPPEADEPLPADEFTRVKRSQLGPRFDHQHPRQQRPAGDVPLDPELVGPHVLVADDPAKLWLGIYDGVQLLHVPALRVAGADFLLVV